MNDFASKCKDMHYVLASTGFGRLIDYNPDIKLARFSTLDGFYYVYNSKTHGVIYTKRINFGKKLKSFDDFLEVVDD